MFRCLRISRRDGNRASVRSNCSPAVLSSRVRRRSLDKAPCPPPQPRKVPIQAKERQGFEARPERAQPTWLLLPPLLPSGQWPPPLLEAVRVGPAPQTGLLRPRAGRLRPRSASLRQSRAETLTPVPLLTPVPTLSQAQTQPLSQARPCPQAPQVSALVSPPMQPLTTSCPSSGRPV